MRLIILMLMFMVPFYAHAGDEQPSLGDIAEGVTESMNEIQTSLLDMYVLIAECELNNACILEEVDKKASENPNNPLWQGLKLDFDRMKDNILAVDEACNVEPAVIVKKAIAGCLKESVADLKKVLDEDKTARGYEQAMFNMEEKIATCIIDNVKPIADEDNVFAILVMLDMTNAPEWSEKLETLKDNEHYKTAMECKSIELF